MTLRPRELHEALQAARRQQETPEWQAVEKSFRRHPPTVIGPFLAWITDGMEDDERAYFRGTIPGPVVAVFTKVFGRGYTKKIAPVWH